MLALNSEAKATALGAAKHTLLDLKQALDPKISLLELACKGMVIGNLDIASFNTAGKAYKNALIGKAVRFLSVEQEVNKRAYKAKVLIADDYFATLLATDVIGAGKKIEVTIERLELGNSSELLIHTQLVVPDGDAQYQLENRRILQECERLGILARIKRPSPALFTRVGLITSGSSTVESDIIRDLSQARIAFSAEADLRRCNSPSEMLAAFRQMDESRQYDVICFFRGGREDQNMSIFRDLELFKAIASASTFTVTGLCHEQDHPVMEEVVDGVFSVPNAFAKTILARNKAYFDGLNEAVTGIKSALRNTHQKIADALAHTLLLVAGEMSKSANLIRGQIDHACSGIANNHASIGRTAHDDLATLQIYASTAIASSIARVGVALDDRSHELAALHTAIQNKIQLMLHKDRSNKFVMLGLIIVLILMSVIAFLLFIK